MLTRPFTVPWYQPETAFQIFDRVMFNKDVATGTTSSSNYSSTGQPTIANITNEVHPGHERYCYLWDMMETCVPEEYVMVMGGSAIIKDYILLGYTALNGTEVWLLNGTSVGEQVMGAGDNVSANETSGSPTGSETEQQTAVSGNGAATMGATDISGLIVLMVFATLLL